MFLFEILSGVLLSMIIAQNVNVNNFSPMYNIYVDIYNEYIYDYK